MFTVSYQEGQNVISFENEDEVQTYPEMLAAQGRQKSEHQLHIMILTTVIILLPSALNLSFFY